MDGSYIKFLEQLFDVKLSNKELEVINSSFNVVDFKKGDIPVHQGDKLTNIYIITKGLVRGFYIDEDGNEVTKCFSAEKQYFSAEGLMSTEGASFNIECLENVRCIQIPYKSLEYIKDNNPEISKKIYNIVLKIYLSSETRTKHILMENAAERYRNFVNENAELAGRLKQKYIASYLGISPVSLSRLKKSGQTFEK